MGLKHALLGLCQTPRLFPRKGEVLLRIGWTDGHRRRWTSEPISWQSNEINSRANCLGLQGNGPDPGGKGGEHGTYPLLHRRVLLYGNP